MRRRAVLVASLAALFLPAAPASAVSSARIIASLNAQRAQNGIPGDILEKAKWSRGCRKHIIWMAQNGVGHDESPGSPGYTKIGAWAGARSVVGYGNASFTTAAANPYVNAPYHLAQILHPRLTVMGAAEEGGFDCETTFPGYKRKTPSRDRIYSYPGPHASIQWAETAREVPYVPGVYVGLPEGTTTGPNMIVYWDGPNRRSAPLTHIKHAAITGPDGKKVAVKRVDYNDLETWDSTGSGFVIPAQPLKPGTKYRAKVTFGTPWRKGDPYYTKHTFTKKWSFTTTPLTSGADAVNLEVLPYDKDNVWIGANHVDPVYAERTATLSATWAQNGQAVASLKPFTYTIDHGGYPITKPSAGETLTVKLVVHGFKGGATTVPAFTLTRTING